MQTYKVILLVIAPTLEEVGKMMLSYCDSINYLESCAFIQEKLAGVWEVDATGKAIKLKNVVNSSEAGEVIYVTLGKPSEMNRLRAHYQHVYENQPSTTIDIPTYEFATKAYPHDDLYDKLSIGAKKEGGRHEVAYAFILTL